MRHSQPSILPLYMKKKYLNRFVSGAACVLLFAPLIFPQTALLNETFNDGDLVHNPRWTGFFATELISIDSTIIRSAPYSCRIATSNQLAAIETPTRIQSSTEPFQITEFFYVKTMGDEAIPLLLRGGNTVLALFLLPGGLVQLDVLKSTSQWVTAQLKIPGGYALNKWHSFRIAYDGAGRTLLYLDESYRGSVDQLLVDTPSIFQIGNRYLPHTSTFFLDDISVVTPDSLSSPANVYLVLCSDTGTWDGLDVSRPAVFLGFDLYTSPTGNAARVINREFRNRIRDSQGKPMAFTWFMLDGSMAATNTNPVVQNRWISNLEMIQRYHGENLRELGDEISFHYHNWVWSDPDGNGVFYWNQWNRLADFRRDFLETLGHIAIEGGLFPTSFRSGWHYMDSQWEALIDSLIPYRFENTSPSRATDVQEPLDNIYDWSRAPLEWIPYHPSATDYQVKGNLRGWETRCVYMKGATLERMLGPFAGAFRGEDQVMTIWSHLPEADFPEQILTVDSIVSLAHEYFPEVKYHYLTATEAMKKWRKIQGDSSPVLTWDVQRDGDNVTLTLLSNEPLWQDAPLVFAKSSANKVERIMPQQKAPRMWRATFDQRVMQYRTLGIAATDTAGNVAVQTIALSPTGVSTYDQQRVYAFRLYPSYPNPFNATTVVSYELPTAGEAEIAVYNINGQLVTTLSRTHRDAGMHSILWDASGIGSGVYFIHLTSGGRRAISKTLVLK